MKTKIIAVVAGVIIVLLGASVYLAYGTSLNNPAVVWLKKIYPAAIVGQSSVSVYDWQNATQIAHSLSPAASSADIATLILLQAQERQLVSNLKIQTSATQLAAESAFIIGGKDADLGQLVNTYFSGRQDWLQQYLIQPRFMDTQLRIKYNSDPTLNADAYKKAQDILTRIQNGEKFEDLAKSLSDDKQTAQLGGDLGFVSPGQVLPELEAAIKNAPVGKVDPQIIPSRAGLHLIYVVETGQNTWHVKHILILTTGYDQWLSAQTGQLRTWQIISS